MEISSLRRYDKNIKEKTRGAGEQEKKTETITNTVPVAN